MIRLIYSIAMVLLTPFLLLRLWWKGRALSSYREGILDRFALNTKRYPPRVDLWIHAVSLGEVVAATPLIEALLQQQIIVLVTTMTPTGAHQVRKNFGTKVYHQYVPYDIPWVLKRFYKRVKPRVAVIMETELWPNLIFYAKKAGIPLFLANARLSERAYKRYRRLKYFFEPILNQFDEIFAQHEDDATWYRALGADPIRVSVLGSVKFDLKIKLSDVTDATYLKACWGEERQVIMLASTHDNEEEQFLIRFSRLQNEFEQPLLLIAPRHPERFQKIYHLSREMGFNVGLRSKIETITRENEVVIVDSLGELLSFYSLSDCAFVGGSLVPIGGHNILEPIAMRTPVLCGPYSFNFKNICSDLQKIKAIEVVDNADELIEKIIYLLNDKQVKDKMVQRASTILESNTGVVAKYLLRINAVLNPASS